MQTQFTPNNKLASFGTIGLLLLAGVAGMVFLLPATPAHAAGAVTLSTISGIATLAGGPQELTGVTSGTVGSTLTLTGTGFNSNAPIEITSTSGTTTISWFTNAPPVVPNTCTGAFASAYGGVGSGNSLYTGSGGTACLTTTATGMFKVTLKVPALPGGAQTIVVSDGTNTVSTSFTITQKIAFAASGASFGFPTQNIGTGTFTLTGFGTGESVAVASSAFTAATFGTPSCTTGSTPGGSSTTGAGSCVITIGGLIVADTTSGSKSITATGATSGLTATTSYTIKPWAAFYNSAGGPTTFSFIGTAPTSLLISVHGMTAQTVAASSITIGGVATSHSAFTIGSSGAAVGIVVSPSATVPFGQTSVVVAGTTFNYASGNIALGISSWGGALISSIIGTGTSTGVASLDASNYKPSLPAAGVSLTNPAPAQNQVGFFGYGFMPATPTGGFISVTTPTGVTWSSVPTFNAGNGGVGGVSGANKPDNNGAFFGTAGLGDTAWSLTATPTVPASYSPTVTQPVAGTNGPANILSPSFGITPWTDTTKSTVIASVVDYSTSTATYTSHGFGATDVLTATVGGAAITGGTGAGTCTAVNGFCVTVVGQVPDLAAGPQNLVVTGSVTGTSVTSTGAVTYVPRIDSSSAVNTALNIVSGSAGSTTILRTGTTFGVHGLYANTAYSVVWNGLSGTVIGTFTSTATGGIPVPGVQVTIPADISGIHIIDIQRTATVPTSFMYGNTIEGDWIDTDPGLGAVYATQYGDMLFNLGTSLIATPTVANVGGSTIISGTGLQANTLYDLGISQAGVDSSSPSIPTTCVLGSTGGPAAPNTIAGQFTSTSGGQVPSGISVSITDIPTFNGLEQGTLYCIFAQTGPNFGTNIAAGVAQFELQASAALNMTSAPSGHNVVMTSHALNAGKGYNILFAPYACGSSSTCGTVVGAILANAQGAGTGTFTVPSTIQTSSGSQPVTSGLGYNVELQAIGSGTVALASPPNLVVGSVSSTSCTSTTCMTASGSPTITTLNGQKTVQTSFTNNSNAPVTAIVYAVVHNAAGQTVAYSTATITANAGASATAYNVLFGLAPGTYSVTIFATTTGGVAISSSSTVSVTI